MNKTNMFLIIGMAGIFSMILAPALSSVPADAQREWSQQCVKNGVPQPGPCPGQSENSPNKQQQNINPSGKNAPPGKQVPERK